MNKDAYLEVNASQKPAIELLQTMGYTYISPEDCEKQRGSRYHVLLKDVLRGQLRKLNRYTYAGVENEFSSANIERAMDDLDDDFLIRQLKQGLLHSLDRALNVRLDDDRKLLQAAFLDLVEEIVERHLRFCLLDKILFALCDECLGKCLGFLIAVKGHQHLAGIRDR